MNKRLKHLFRKYLDNSCTKEEFDEFFAIVEQEADQQSLEEVLSAMSEDKQVVRPMNRNRMLTAITVAASVILVAAGGWWWSGQQGQGPVLAAAKQPETKVTKATAKSEYKYLLLPDSTQVWLNADSKLDFPAIFDSAKRVVQLTGEAYFDVKHADKIPFIIHTGEVSTEVLGTAFNIKAYPDLEKITISVKRGKVKVNYANKQVALLTKGEEVVIGNRSKEAREKPVKEELTSAWQEGNLVYEDYSVGDILADLERVYDVKIDVNSPVIRNLRVTTSFRRQYGVEHALEILGKLTETKIAISNGSYIINQK